MLIWPRGYKNDRPSVQTIFEVLELIKVVIVNGERYLPKNIDQQALSIGDNSPHIVRQPAVGK